MYIKYYTLTLYGVSRRFITPLKLRYFAPLGFSLYLTCGPRRMADLTM